MPAVVVIDPSDEVTSVGAPPEETLAAPARRFELPALLRVLRKRGFGPKDIWFERAWCPGAAGRDRLEPVRGCAAPGRRAAEARMWEIPVMRVAGRGTAL